MISEGLLGLTQQCSSICSLKVNFESKTNPKCSWVGQRGLLLNFIDGLASKVIN